MRGRCLDMVHKLAKADERIVFLGSDLGFGTLKKFREELPERFIMEGINEAHAIGMAAGLAFDGRIVYVNT
ncbi:MAG: transketolase, partial [Humidesulfovibrio sp.]|nr:transketolase [Humidesulfovibrio sp.]